MSVIQSNGLHLRVGDGGAPETYTALAGCEIKHFEITQSLIDSNAIAMTPWSVGVSTAERRATVECTALATDSAAALRLRFLAMSSTSGNFQLNSSASELLSFAAFVVQYREDIQAGAVKRIRFRLDSTGAIVAS